MKKICLAGYSGHGFVVAEIINLLQHNLVAYIDIEEKKHDPFSLKYLGNENELDLSFLKQENMYVALGAGDNSIRKKIYNLSSRNPLISIAPHNEISPSPWEKCISPVLRFAPSKNTGR